MRGLSVDSLIKINALLHVMTFLKISLLVLPFMLGAKNCERAMQSNSDKSKAAATTQPEDLKGYSTAYFASGCFWCVEAVYESVKGVKESISGYAGGHTDVVNYELSNTGTTGHAEAVEIYYDSSMVDFPTLVDVYFGSQDVTQVNGQGPDRGSQYRSILFYANDQEKAIIAEKIAEQNEIYNGKVAAEVQAFTKFYLGEDYHQDYEKRNPNQPYIRGVSVPRLKRFQAKFPELIEDAH